MYVYLYAIYMLCVRVWLCVYKVSFNYKPFCQRAFTVLSSKSGGLVFSPKLRLFVWESHEQPSQYREGGSIQVLLGLQGLVPMGGGKGPEFSGICWSSSNRRWKSETSEGDTCVLGYCSREVWPTRINSPKSENKTQETSEESIPESLTLKSWSPEF